MNINNYLLIIYMQIILLLQILKIKNHLLNN